MVKLTHPTSRISLSLIDSETKLSVMTETRIRKR